MKVKIRASKKIQVKLLNHYSRHQNTFTFKINLHPKYIYAATFNSTLTWGRSLRLWGGASFTTAKDMTRKVGQVNTPLHTQTKESLIKSTELDGGRWKTVGPEWWLPAYWCWPRHQIKPGGHSSPFSNETQINTAIGVYGFGKDWNRRGGRMWGEKRGDGETNTEDSPNDISPQTQLRPLLTDRPNRLVDCEKARSTWWGAHGGENSSPPGNKSWNWKGREGGFESAYRHRFKNYHGEAPSRGTVRDDVGFKNVF